VVSFNHRVKSLQVRAPLPCFVKLHLTPRVDLAGQRLMDISKGKTLRIKQAFYGLL
jgi:hypothetical protein